MVRAGDKTEQLQYRLSNGEWSRRMEPRAVVLSVGINNILRERIYDRTSDSVVERVANRAKDDMRELIAFFHQQDCGIRVVVQAVLPTATGEKNEWPGRFTRPIERVNARYRELAEEYQHVSFIDCGDLFIEVNQPALRRRDEPHTFSFLYDIFLLMISPFSLPTSLLFY
jgi:hypothetical protein